MNTRPLHHDPLLIFLDSRTPPALYARQKWMNQARTRAWQADFKTTVDDLLQGRGADGWWQDSALETIHRLFGLHLTVRDADETIRKGLRRLLETADGLAAAQGQKAIDPEALRGLPFAPAPASDLILPATLFLATIFGMNTDPVVHRLYDGMVAGMDSSPAMAGHPAAGIHNRFRALVVHPRYAGHPATRRVVRWLSGRQDADGGWGEEIPFYQMLNALAHLDPALTGDPCQKAFDRLVVTQNDDGSWGDEQRQWDSFLVVHALRSHHRL